MPSINVTSTAAVPILGRLLTATLASRDAFAHAAGAIRPATLAARLADEAEHQRHIADTCGRNSFTVRHHRQW
jgi:hypothetical protein